MEPPSRSWESSADATLLGALTSCPDVLRLLFNPAPQPRLEHIDARLKPVSERKPA